MTQDMAVRLMSVEDGAQTVFPDDNITVSVDAEGEVTIAVPNNDIPLHPKAVALVAAALKLDDADFVQQMTMTLA